MRRKKAYTSEELAMIQMGIRYIDSIGRLRYHNWRDEYFIRYEMPFRVIDTNWLSRHMRWCLRAQHYCFPKPYYTHDRI
jgi:hypothetical protein